MSARDEKTGLRERLLDERLGLSLQEAKSYSERILNTLTKYIDWKRTHKIYTYSPIRQYNEIDTDTLVGFLRRNHPDIIVETAPNKLSSNEAIPQGGEYDLVITPVLGFDRRGFRLGYGGGYYDKFLARNKCKEVIGLAYSFSEVEKIPNEEHDKKVSLIITEKEIIKPKK